MHTSILVETPAWFELTCRCPLIQCKGCMDVHPLTLEALQCMAHYKVRAVHDWLHGYGGASLITGAWHAD